MPPTPLLSDNKASTFTANNPTTGVRSKHIDVRFLKVREYIAAGMIRVAHVRTDYNISDFFTKGLTIQKYSNFRNLLMGEQPTRHNADTKGKVPFGFARPLRAMTVNIDRLHAGNGEESKKHRTHECYATELMLCQMPFGLPIDSDPSVTCGAA